MRPLDPASPLSPEFLFAVSETLSTFLDAKTPLLDAVGATDLLPVAREYVGAG